MTKNQPQALATFGMALVVGAIAQAVIKREAVILGLSAFEVALLGLAVGSVVNRSLT